MAPLRIAPFFMYALLASGCAPMLQSFCASDEQRSINELIYFGTAAPNGPVTPEAWEAFLSSSVTPRFPQGLTFWQASGQWQGAGGAITREYAFVLNLVRPDDDRSEASIRTIIAEYKSHFRQEAVLRVRSPACASF